MKPTPLLNVLEDVLIGEEQKRKFILENPDIVEEIARNNLTKSDIVALAYRKQQLTIFERLLCDDDFFRQKQKEWERAGEESVWQKYFEDNQWIFGYGLSYIFLSSLDERKLEQITTGFAINQGGKRTDALMKTRGIISSLCFVEIKTHRTPLLYRRHPYRSDCWRISDELAGGVAQIQKTVQMALKTIETKLHFEDALGFPTDEVAFLYQPRSFLVIGSLSEFTSPRGVNEQQFGSFELFRRNISSPEIITFDELYERAKFIVQQSEGGAQKLPNDQNNVDDEIPF